MYFNKKEAKQFLEAIRPCGLINLGGIHPSGGPPIMQTFSMPEEIQQALIFLTDLAKRGFNLHFEPNPPTHKINRKAKGKDIAQVEWLVLDLDPDCTQGYLEGVAAVWDKKEEVLMTVPMPDIVIKSGNGIQAFYKLDPASTDFASCKRMNEAIATLHGGDSTYSVDHLFRIPGTLNYPTKAKLEKGYPEKPNMSSIIFMEARSNES